MYNDNNQNNYNNYNTQGGYNQPPVQPNMGYNPQPTYNQNMNYNQPTGQQPVNMQGYNQSYQQPVQQQYPSYNNQGLNANNMVNNGGIFNPTKEIPNGGEDTLKGIIGGIVGSLLGAIVLILLYQVGRVAVASGIAIAALTLIGYEKLAGGLSKKGIIICVVIMIAAVFVGHTVGISMLLSAEFKKVGYDISTLDILKDYSAYWDVFSTNPEWKSLFWGNLVLNYVFCGIGGFYIVKDKINKLKNS